MIIGLILQAEQLEDPTYVPSRGIVHKVPFLEVESPTGETNAQKLSQFSCGQRLIKTHLPVELLQENLSTHPKVKIIQNIRNPKDTLVSYYHHMQTSSMLGEFTGTWDQYFELFKANKLPSGDYFKITSDWYKFNKDRENSLILTYEEMKKDHRGHVIKIAKFLGHDLSDTILDLIVEYSTVKSMSKTFAPTAHKKLVQVRKGLVGDWMNYFSQEQSDYVDALCEKHWRPLGLSFEFSA